MTTEVMSTRILGGTATADPERWRQRLWMRVRLFCLSCLGFLAYPAGAWSRTDRAAYVVLGVFALAYAWVIWRNTPVPQTNRAPRALLIAIACGAALLPELGSDWLSGLGFYVSVMLLISLGQRWQRTILFGLPIASIGIGLVYPRETPATLLTIAVQLLIVTGILIAVFRQLRTETELRAARAELAQLAVINERIRIARDVHDILGQRLSAVVLKADLAAQRSTPPHPEMLEVAAIGREALGEMRAAISGYRRASLVVEVQSATALLSAAGVHAVVIGELKGLPQRIDETAAWLVREAAINVIRHANAANCEVEIQAGDTMVVLEVRDDGVGAMSSEAPAWGSGLTGLAERVALIGGEVQVSNRSAWFTVRAELPRATSATAP
jgi:two-component system sensor histidine kinase DesK